MKNYKIIAGRSKQTMARKMSDEERGYRDRMVGYYDKWFRYNRPDDGAAYDRGCTVAVNTGKCPDHFTLIPACDAMRA